MRRPVIVDTNVAKVANAALEPDTEWDPECVHACVEAIADTMAGGRLVLDDLGLILEEYGRQLGHAGMPGLGHAFAKWAFDHQYDARVCTRVAITPHEDSFHEFPDDPALAEFDHSDRKFVAAALAHEPPPPPILQAVDSKWWGLRHALAAAGVVVTFVHEPTIRALHERKVRP
ncbi:MAG TPA: hypothetical protein VNZ62_08400 [Capillimicrobium sp.]|nr:hypothetical protein [Capillimicrobium sp.]